MSQTIRSWSQRCFATATLTVALSGGCQPLPEDEGPGTVEVVDSELLLASGVTKWSGGNIPVCWTSAARGRGDFGTRANPARLQAIGSWPEVARVQFKDWSACKTADPSGFLQINLTDNATSDSDIGTAGSASRTMNLGQDSTTSAGVAVHEFGHALGFSHEMRRGDFADDGSGSCRESNQSGDTLGTPAQRQSVMALTYCPEASQTLTDWDVVGVERSYGTRTNGFQTVVSYWSGARGDHGMAVSNSNKSRMENEGYRPAYTEGWIFTKQAPSTTPLKLFFHSGRGDYFSAATTAGINSARAAGYSDLGTQGFVYSTRQSGTVALQLYWSSARSDNFLTLEGSPGETAAINAGYTFVRTEGFTFASRPFKMLRWYWNNGRGDNLLAPVGTNLANTAESGGDSYVGFDLPVLVFGVPGTTTLVNFWHAGRGDNFQTATTAGVDSAGAANYSLTEVLGYVFTTQVSGTTAIKQFWHGGRSDNFLTGTQAGFNAASAAGYSSVRTEGFTFTQ
jgi:hypothetical protein